MGEAEALEVPRLSRAGGARFSPQPLCPLGFSCAQPAGLTHLAVALAVQPGCPKRPELPPTARPLPSSPAVPATPGAAVTRSL